MGRTPAPAALKLLKGRTAGHDSGGRPVKLPPPFQRAAPTAPGWLSAEARAEWDRVVPGLTRLDLLKTEDRAVLAAYCETWATFVAATRTVQREGLTVEARLGGTQAHPAVGIARNAGRELKGLAVQFGLTPSSEQALGRLPEDDDDSNPFAG